MQISLFDDLEKKPTTGPKTVLLIDGNNLLNRCFYATVKSVERLPKDSDSRLTNGVSSFVRSLLSYRKSLEATHIGVTFDEGRGFRARLYPAYKDGRKETPRELKLQFPILKEVLKCMGISMFSSKEYEADDLIGSLATALKEDKVYILSNDKDLHQLVTDSTIQIVRKGSNDVMFDKNTFLEQYNGLQPEQITDLKAIAGDSSDNIIGIPGIGDKGAYNLIDHFSSVEEMIKGDFPSSLKRYEEKVKKHEEDVLLAKKLTPLVKDVEVDISSLTSTLDIDGTIGIFGELSFHKLLEEIKTRKIDL
ncbi:5'-3' exonuclease [Peribacillus asahii]|uniref:5'-3' exonuclease n=1 Tax=Peribacillus asahii TaxID=228899 RepID=UPI0020794481|nr:5'-3' exonuclease H3TH domain-containing protein [Peribacillus asahii]USK62240.1 5'-3' exonuclease [Peribacillus asahii]